MQLYYIRHAQSENNALYLQTGNEGSRHQDPEITEIGRQQAQCLADFLAQPGKAPAQDPDDLQNRSGFQFTHLYCSLMVRSIQTASLIAQRMSLPLVALNNLHEGGGIFLQDKTSGENVGQPGNDRAYFAQNFPDLALPEIDETGWWNRPFETREERVQRASMLLDEILARHDCSEDKIALVSHGGFYNYFLGAILKLPPPLQVGEENPRARTWLSLNNVAITRVDFIDHEVRLVYHNRLDFLPPNLVT